VLTGRNRDDAPNLIALPDSMHRIAVLLAVLGATLAAGSAQAQLGALSGDSPPRPPADVPNGSFPPQPPPVHYPGQSSYPPPAAAPPPAQYPAQSSLPPRPQYPAQSSLPPPSAGPPPSGIQAEPLPPPPGAVSAPPGQGARLTPPGANPPPQSADAPPQPDDAVITEMPIQKIENSRAVFSGLDKITGRIIAFDAAIGETVQFGALQVTARVCYTRPPTEATNTDAFVQVDEVTLQGEVKRIFSGWMFAASPGLHAVEHPIYDVWLNDCASPIKVAEPAAPPVAVAPARSRTRQAAPPRQQPAPAAQVQPR
jgi:hypothetical protein